MRISKWIVKFRKYTIRYLKIFTGYFLLIPSFLFKNNTHILIILGMHRSGTSCITKIFNLNGIKLGNDLLSSQNDNPRGFWEDWYLVKINRQILKRSKGSWNNPPKKIKVSIKDKLDILNFLNLNRKAALCIKDPRMLLTWEVWKPFLKNYQLVGVFRNPESVSKSLNKRNNFDINSGYSLWNKYNKNLIKISNNEKISIINFDNSNSFKNKISEIVNNFGIEFNPDSLKYYNPKYLNSKFQDLNDIKNNLDTYNELIRLEKNIF